MNTSKVYFTNLRTTPSSNLLDKMERLVKRAGIANIDFKNGGAWLPRPLHRH